MKKVLIVVGSIIGFVAMISLIMVITLSSNMKTIRNIEIQNIDFTSYEDGTYIGAYYYENQIGATLEVTILNGEVIEINITDHIYGKGGIAEVITADIIEDQSLMVDAIAGATTSSHIIKLAIQDALEE